MRTIGSSKSHYVKPPLMLSCLCAHLLSKHPTRHTKLADAGAREPDFLHVCCAKYAEIIKFVSLVHWWKHGYFSCRLMGCSIRRHVLLRGSLG